MDARRIESALGHGVLEQIYSDWAQIDRPFPRRRINNPG